MKDGKFESVEELRAWLNRKPPLKSADETGSAESAPPAADVGPGTTNPTDDEVRAALNEGSPF